MKRLLKLLLLLVAMPGVVLAGSREESAIRLLETMDMERTLSTTIEQMLDMQIDQNPQMQPFKGVMMEFFDKYMSFSALKQPMVNLYAEAFTEQELEDMVAFYSTPTGKKAVALMPDLMAKGGEIGQRQVEEHMGELQSMIMNEAQRLEAEKEQQRAAEAPASEAGAAPAEGAVKSE